MGQDPNATAEFRGIQIWTLGMRMAWTPSINLYLMLRQTLLFPGSASVFPVATTPSPGIPKALFFLGHRS